MKPNLGEIIADKYRLDRVLGKGGMSTVYAAVNVATGKPVAIKLLQPELMRDAEQSQRLLREAQVASAVDHPNVVNVFDIGDHAGSLFLVMELLHGEPLSALLQSGPQDPCEFVRLMMPVLRGVHAAHRVGVVHRDLKPDNIFICCDQHGELREPKVLDFGISKLSNNAFAPSRELTRDGTVFGTPQYMAPEQMRDAHATDARSDVYALGVIFYRAFSNAYPYDADTLTALAIRIVEGNAVPLHELCPQLDRELADLVMHALTLDPDARFPSVAAFGLALEPFADGVMFAPGSSDRESLTPRRESSVPFRTGTSPVLGPSPTRENARLNSSLARDNARFDASLARDNARFDRAPSRRPPPPPRVGPLPAASHAAEKLTRALDPSDLIGAVELIEPRRERKLSVPPPPRPSLARPSRGLEVVVDDPYTQRFDRGGRRQSWVLSASLVVIGLLAPAGWQQWQKARGAATLPPLNQTQGAFMGKTANVYAAQALRPENALSTGSSSPRAPEQGAARTEPLTAPVTATGLHSSLARPSARIDGSAAPTSAEPEPASAVAEPVHAPKKAALVNAKPAPKVATSKEELARQKARTIAAPPVRAAEPAQPATAEGVGHAAGEAPKAVGGPVAADAESP